MELPGSLARTTLGDVLGALYRERATGTLEIVERSGVRAGRTHRIRFDRGLVTEVCTQADAPRLGEILRREGFIGSRTLLDFERRLYAEPQRRCGEILVGERIVEGDVVRAALRHQQRARLDALFRLEDGRLAFRVACRSSAEDDAVPLAPREFLYGRPRRRDGDLPREVPRADREEATPPPGRRRDPARARALSTLGLPAESGVADVQRAFRRLASRMHPDRFPRATSDQKALLMRRFAEISAAYHALVA